MKYTNFRGVSVSPERIQELLSSVGKTEEEVLEFLGGDVPGEMLHFLELFSALKRYAVPNQA